MLLVSEALGDQKSSCDQNVTPSGDLEGPRSEGAIEPGSEGASEGRKETRE